MKFSSCLTCSCRREEFGQKPGNLDLQPIDIDVKFLKVNIIILFSDRTTVHIFSFVIVWRPLERVVFPEFAHVSQITKIGHV